MSQSNYHRLANGTVYSYSTCIRQEIAGLSIGNITRYSVTTSRHQSQAQCVSCDVLLDNVPRDTPELLQLAIQRGAILVTMEMNLGTRELVYTKYRESHHG